jgi:hypothetical protein
MFIERLPIEKAFHLSSLGYASLKGQSHEIFDLRFFHQTIIRMHGACGVIDSSCTVHTVSLTSQYRARGVNNTACKIKNANNFTISNLYSKRL